METKNISVRGVGVNAWRNFRAMVIKKDLGLGDAVTEALKLYTKHEIKERPKYRFMDMKPVDFGPGNENLSGKIDGILYGDEK